MADLIHEAIERTAAGPTVIAPVPESLEPDEAGWPELLAAGDGVTDDAAPDYLRWLGRMNTDLVEGAIERALVMLPTLWRGVKLTGPNLAAPAYRASQWCSLPPDGVTDAGSVLGPSDTCSLRQVRC
jgi:hypothetical protein